MQKKQRKWFIGGLIIAATVVSMSVLSLKNNTVYFYTPDEAVEKYQELREKTIKIGGMVQVGSVEWTMDTLHLKFTLSDLNGSDIVVEHRGSTPPDMFKEGQGVVVEGTLDSKDHFTARTLMVKHSEEYKAPDDQHSVDKNLLKKSIFKD